LGKIKTGFRVRFRSWTSRYYVHCKSARGVTSSSIIKELLLTLSRRSKRACNLPPCLPGIERVTALKTLGVTITGTLSMSEHVRDVVRKCALSLHIIRVLRCRCMNDQALQAVYRSVVIGAKLLNAACAWWGFTTADDRNRIEAVVRWMGQRQRSSQMTLMTCCSVVQPNSELRPLRST